MFDSPKPEVSSAPVLVWILAALVVFLSAGFIVLHNRSHATPDTKTLRPLAPEAGDLALSGIIMSESTSLSGGKSTYIDGHVRNVGVHTINNVTVQVLFGSFDASQPPQLETTPLTLIRTHDPYIDTEPMMASPLAPGQEREFRLIFEDVSPNWDQQVPTIHVVQVQTH